ncbi:hypothetical protein FM037_21865 [Shewanella psychropiezotolerans]|uniref:Uncharacterized protein n=1 Tax=Shewanella psychropiezotolerans TaxID=2593655 RepID=A0ABX5X2K7_9GAMM|nr:MULTISPECIES: hypothetical protein [Shewanella]MPY23320.1 hypothetical protein [Shewanella sp. YLB-07]QDO85411.1 hypothetical protein FM037_21865 [Shewanella psychropiezotolerans]
MRFYILFLVGALISTLCGFFVSKMFISETILYEGGYHLFHLNKKGVKIHEQGKIVVRVDHIQIRGVELYPNGSNFYSFKFGLKGLRRHFSNSISLEDFTCQRAPQGTIPPSVFLKNEYFLSDYAFTQSRSRLELFTTNQGNYYLDHDRDGLVWIISEEGFYE